ncbi:MAG: hypothetical protein Q9162_003708 [Coniocarpon cinnabarinum]
MPLNFPKLLLNSASPWASDKQQLTELYNSPYTGAVTVRSTLLTGFDHDDRVNQWTFYDARSNTPMPNRSPNANSSINTYGYSPTSLSDYLAMIEEIVAENPATFKKPFVVSVTGTAHDVAECRRVISAHARTTSIPLLMEINLSCPNIVNKPPPAYSSIVLQEYLFALQRSDNDGHAILTGIKTSPYTYHDQFVQIIDALKMTTGGGLRCPVDFITATNTLGNCLVMTESEENSRFVPAVNSASGFGLGGAGGSAIHSLSLGNVATLRRLLDAEAGLKHIEIIGVGGVSDYQGYERMMSAGASAVAIGTAFGKEGIEIFHKISNELRTVGSTLEKVY